MDAIEHSVIATTLLAVFYYAGMFVDKRKRVEEAIANTLATLEDNNYIICETDEDGQKVLQEVVRKPETL
jgi:hypothetical protein